MSDINPIAKFKDWFDQACQVPSIDKPNALTLATCGAGAVPDARIVLLSRYDEQGFVFHSNYFSRKGEQLAAHAQAAMVFWWDELGYQVRIRGQVEKTSGEQSDAYFAGRPRGSQLGAWASEQSQVIEGRYVLEQRLQECSRRFQDKDVMRPPHWGGYRVLPREMEFWENREDRLHHRDLYTRDDNGQWQVQIIAP